jgi:hypothetical protein
MNPALHWRRVVARNSWRQARVGGLQRPAPLGAVASARRTSAAYAGYLTSIAASGVIGVLAWLILPAWYLFLGQDLARTAQRPADRRAADRSAGGR